MQYLSQAGIEVLIKAVIQAIPTYSMRIFKIPKNILMELNRLMQQYWWGQKAEKKKRIHWYSWGKLRQVKVSGGLGLRDLEQFNLAMLAKQERRSIQNSPSLAAKVFSTKYFPNGNFLKAGLNRSPSLIWRSIMVARPLIEEGLFWHIGNDCSTKIWHDKWLPCPTCFKVQSPVKNLEPEATVDALIDPVTSSWRMELINETFLEKEAATIIQTPISLCNSSDRISWRCTTNGIFSVRSAYDHLQLKIRQRA
ncbi:hypothetical protein F2P56_007888 [Juglans regia]|uniref:Uncharacterized mitochondrial protein AtMg00310-like n=2 Tax=Juglans regia TaxID=51240 RepID=A0A2I4DNJ7_JUGRE|nr:uncharacterized mitochondrial protein AtMg00310-like [Juglans regia]KAF5476152.1 hypothetical protein F2P56_007888 [Juglans regia]